MGPNNEGDEPSITEVVLRNPLILRQIFTHLPTQILISSCSLVNKVWNREARTFVREQRECLARITSHTACQRLQELDQFCAKLAEDGRMIPFNGLNITDRSYQSRLPCLEFTTGQDESAYMEKLQNLLTLTHLEVNIFDTSETEFRCPAYKKLVAWLQNEKRNELQSLKIENGNGVLMIEIFGDEPDPDYYESEDESSPPDSEDQPIPEFPQLQSITIPYMILDDEKEFMRKIYKSAPNLKKVFVESGDMVEFLPSEMYKLLYKVPFHVENAKKEKVFRKIAQAQPKLQELEIIGPFSTYSDSDDEMDVASIDPVVEQRSNKVLEELLQACHTSLETVYVKGLIPLGRLSCPPLTNLSKIRMHKCINTGTQRFWSDVVAIDYREVMPNLEEIEINDFTKRSGSAGYCGDFEVDLSEEEEESDEWPTYKGGSAATLQRSSNARKLILDFQNKDVNMFLLQSIAPNVSFLELRIGYTSTPEADLAPFSHIWKLYPKLVQLKITVSAECPGRNYDADFCGIYEKEAAFLRGRDEEYLQAVHIVPVRPSLCTMTELRKLELDIKFWGDGGSSSGNPPLNFTSNVTRMVVFKRMTQTDICIS